MATWIDDQELNSEILNALEEWRNNCLLKDGSVFTEKNLWTRDNFSTLEKLFIENPIDGNDSFYNKLQIQLKDAPVDVVQLASEMLWLTLFYAYEKIKVETKNKHIIELWELSKESFPDTEKLSEVVNAGFASPGTNLFRRNRDYGFLIKVLKQWKTLNSDEQSRLLTDNPLGLCNKIDSFADYQPIRHMFLYYCYPSYYERICSRRQKEQIYKAYSDLLESTNDPYKQDNSLCGLDHAIHKIRKCLEKQYETSKLDFFNGVYSNGNWIDLRSKWDSEQDIRETKQKSSTEKIAPEDVVEELFIEKTEIDHILKIWQGRKNLIIQGAPGVGKTFAAYKLAYKMIKQNSPECVGFVQFHSSYSYEDFIQGYRPSKNGFELQDGKFKIFCDKAHGKPNDRFVFIIDEINRGDLSKILGELLLLIEPDKRSEDWATPLTYSNTGEKFFVPENVYLLGLMNTADRSLAVVDYALRRRFCFYEMVPQFNSEKFQDHLHGNGISDDMVELIRARIGNVNKKIVADRFLGPGFRIGHSYFCDELYESQENEWYEIIVNSQIIPLLEEYYFDKPDRIEELKKELLPDSEE